MTGWVRRADSTRRTGRRRSAALVVLTTAAVVSCSRSGEDTSAEPPGSTAPSTSAPSDASPTTDAGPTTDGGPTTGEQPPALGPVDAVRTVVISDEGTSTSAGAWPDLLVGTLEDVGIPMSVQTTAPEGAGFGSSPSFADLVAENAEGSTQLVVLFDSRLTGAEGLARAARDTFTAVERAAPDAMLVVVGPLPTEETGEPARASAELEAATRDAGGAYVDALAEGWPTDVTQPEIAELLRLHLQPLSESLAASGANR